MTTTPPPVACPYEGIHPIEVLACLCGYERADPAFNIEAPEHLIGGLPAKHYATMYLANRLGEGAHAIEAFSQFMAAEMPDRAADYAPRLRAALDTLSDANGDTCAWIGEHYPDGPEPNEDRAAVPEVPHGD